MSDVTPQNLLDVPISTPVLFEGLATMTSETGTYLGWCVEFHRFELGSRTDLPDEIPEIMAHTVNIHVDGRKLDDWVQASSGWFDHTICFNHTDTSEGLHVAAIEFSTTSGENNRYMWAFRISTNNDGKAVVYYHDSL